MMEGAGQRFCAPTLADAAERAVTGQPTISRCEFGRRPWAAAESVFDLAHTVP
jgi:hypothetical protein